MSKDTDPLFKKRHSLAHLLAIAVREFDPGVKLAIGPVIDNGFYYDFEFSKEKTPTPNDLKSFEKRIKHLVKQNITFTCKDISLSDAKSLFADQPYKLELIEGLAKDGESMTIYESGPFTDLCAGPHVENTKEIDGNAFKLTHIAGAYWRGDEKRPMLTRIYSLAFNTKEELDGYVKQQEEAKKRDHKIIGKELGLFVFSELVGAGLPLWTPKGTLIRELLNDYVWKLREAKGYQKVTIPHITKKDLYEKSGHWAKFADELLKIETRERHLFAVKPMNCPHHTQIFDAAPRSYRDMPQRYCETTMVYRDEQSGELSGLSRVRSITQDDAHVFCRENQIESEIFAIWDIIDTFYKTFGFELNVRFSRHDPEHFENYIGEKETWSKAEVQIKDIISKRGVRDVIDGKGEAAMYGPKIDFIAKDSLGRVLQVATIQLDFNMPQRFGLVCTNEKGMKESIVMIHCAIMGSIERFMGTLIEHFAGNFPVWLSPVQVRVLSVRENHAEYAHTVYNTLKAAGIRAEIDDTDEGLGKKVRTTKNEKIPYFIIVGDKDIEVKKVTVEHRDRGALGQFDVDGIKAHLVKENADKGLK